MPVHKHLSGSSSAGSKDERTSPQTKDLGRSLSKHLGVPYCATDKTLVKGLGPRSGMIAKLNCGGHGALINTEAPF